MFDVNVLGTLRVTQALLPALDASGAGTIVIISSTAGLIVYEGGGGYAAAKHAQTALAETLRLELCGRPVRVVEIDPGMVRTDEFALVRFDGDAEKAAAVVRRGGRAAGRRRHRRLVACAATRPHHVNIDRLVVRPLAQAAQHKVDREPEWRTNRVSAASERELEWSLTLSVPGSGCGSEGAVDQYGLGVQFDVEDLADAVTDLAGQPEQRRSWCRRPGWSAPACACWTPRRRGDRRW